MAKRGHLYYILLLAALGAYVFNIVQEGAELSQIAAEKKANLRKRRMIDDRLLAVTKSSWKECRAQKMSGEECKNFIDLEIYNLFTDRDRYIRTIIKGKRKKTDEYYNAVTILIGDNDMVEGLQGDGIVTYEFTWDGSGEKATAEQQAAIPPITAMESGSSLTEIGVEEGTLATVPPIDAVDATAGETGPTPEPGAIGVGEPELLYDYNTYVYDDDVVLEEPPLVVFDEVITGVDGATVDQFIAAESTEPTATAGAGTDDAGAGTTTDTTAPIAGGVLTDGTAQSTPEGDAKIETALAEAVAAGDTVPEAGSRTIGPFDCSGMTGPDCCAYIKLQVPDSDLQGNAIQCTVNYSETSQKKKYWNNLRGKKVHIFENHNGRVTKDPKIVGNWPTSLEGEDKLPEFEAWLREAGALPLIMQQST